MNIFDNLKNGISDFCASVAAKYHQYVNTANAQACQNAKTTAYTVAVQTLYPDYLNVADILAEAINNTSAITHLVPVSNPSQILCNPWLLSHKSGVWVYKFHALYSKGYGMTASSVQRILQAEINRLCGIYNFPRFVVNVVFDPNGQVEIKTCYAADMAAVKAVTP